MPGLPEDAVAQLGELPVVVAVLLISLVSVVWIMWLVFRHLAQTETSRRDERQTRDSVFLKFIEDQRELDRSAGKAMSEAFTSALNSLSDTFSRALSGLADAIRDNGTATLAVMNEIRSRVDDAMNVHTVAIRENNYMLAKLGQQVDDLVRRASVNHDDPEHEASDKKARR